MSRFGVMKHLGVLERARIVVARRHGRIRMNHLNVAPLRALQERWVSAHAGRLADAVRNLEIATGESPMSQSRNDETGVVDVALEWPIAATIQRVWQTLFNSPEAWWPAAHRAGLKGSTMSFEPCIGGQLREERQDGAGLVWYSVIALEPMKSVDLTGFLAARYGGPATSLLHLELVPGAEDNSTILKLTDSVFGRIGPGLRASLTEGWQAIIGQGFVGALETGRPDND